MLAPSYGRWLSSADLLRFRLKGEVIVVQVLSHSFQEYSIVSRVKKMIVNHSSVDVQLQKELGSYSTRSDSKSIKEEMNCRARWSQDDLHSLIGAFVERGLVGKQRIEVAHYFLSIHRS